MQARKEIETPTPIEREATPDGEAAAAVRIKMESLLSSLESRSLIDSHRLSVLSSEIRKTITTILELQGAYKNTLNVNVIDRNLPTRVTYTLVGQLVDSADVIDDAVKLITDETETAKEEVSIQ